MKQDEHLKIADEEFQYSRKNKFKRGMKGKLVIGIRVGLFSILFVLNSCVSKTRPLENYESFKRKEFAKRWILSKDKELLGNKTTSHLILSLEKDGYFLVYDTIVDAKFLSAGIKKIQPISKGQWGIKYDKLILNHLLPNSHKEFFKIKSIKKNRLVIVDFKKNHHTYTANHK